MNPSQPLITPEELYCLLGWPMPVDTQNSQTSPASAAPANAAPAASDASLALAS